MFWNKPTKSDAALANQKRPRSPEEIKAFVASQKSPFSPRIEWLQHDLEKIKQMTDAGDRYNALKNFQKEIDKIELHTISLMALGLSRRKEYIKNALILPVAVVLTPVLGLAILFFKDMKENNRLAVRRENISYSNKCSRGYRLL